MLLTYPLSTYLIDNFDIYSFNYPSIFFIMHLSVYLFSSFFHPIFLGTIDAKELKVAMRALGFEPKKEEIKKMISGKRKR